MKRYSIALCVLILSIVMLSAFNSFAEPWASVPSGLTVGTVAEISGGGFSPEQAFTLQVTYPDNSIEFYDATSLGNGEFIYGLLLSLPGEYLAQVLSDNSVIAEVIIVASE